MLDGLLFMRKSWFQWSRPNISNLDTYYTLNFPISFTKSIYCIMYGELVSKYTEKIHQVTDLVFYENLQTLSSTVTESIVFYPNENLITYAIGYVYMYFMGI